MVHGQLSQVDALRIAGQDHGDLLALAGVDSLPVISGIPCLWQGQRCAWDHKQVRLQFDHLAGAFCGRNRWPVSVAMLPTQRENAA
jgi:hypothetical protein